MAHWGLFNYMLSPHVRANNLARAIIHVVIRINTLSTNAVRLGARTTVRFYSVVTPFVINLQQKFSFLRERERANQEQEGTTPGCVKPSSQRWPLGPSRPSPLLSLVSEQVERAVAFELCLNGLSACMKRGF